MTTPTQRWNATDYATNARFVSDLGQPVLDLLQPEPGERILDLCCGDGALTARLAERGATVVGVDASAELLAAARARGLDARQMDARALTFTNEFDAVFSNAALHWIPTLGPVLEGVHRALRPHGRFVGECGGHGCLAAVMTSLRAVATRRGVEIAWPWRFPTVDEFEADLAASGFEVTGRASGAETHRSSIRDGGVAPDLRRLGFRTPPRSRSSRRIRGDGGTITSVALRLARALDSRLYASPVCRTTRRGAELMRYYTQLVFVRPGKEEAFHEFEDHVLPLLAMYGGQLLLRWRYTPGVVIDTTVGDPYEVHLVAFPTADDFRRYASDDTRTTYLHLKDSAVERVMLIEGVLLS